jgi:hypothetical protein
MHWQGAIVVSGAPGWSAVLLIYTPSLARCCLSVDTLVVCSDLYLGGLVADQVLAD